MKKLKLGISAILLTAVMVGCNEEEAPNPAEFMYEHFEESVTIEKAVEDLQGPLTEAENNEFEWYEEMLTLSELEEIEELAEQAIQSAEERRTLMDEEKEIIDNAYEEFQLASEFVEDFEEEEIREKAESVMAIMTERYETYQELYTMYMETIDMDVELYTMLFEEELTVEELQEKHESVNEAYREINELNSRFNELTADFNSSKREFYELSGLQVVFE